MEDVFIDGKLCAQVFDEALILYFDVFQIDQVNNRTGVSFRNEDFDLLAVGIGRTRTKNEQSCAS